MKLKYTEFLDFIKDDEFKESYDYGDCVNHGNLIYDIKEHIHLLHQDPISIYLNKDDNVAFVTYADHVSLVGYDIAREFYINYSFDLEIEK